MLEQMRTKSFVILLACIIATSILVCLYGDPKPSIHEIVTETHRHFSQWKKLQVVDSAEKEPIAEERYLKHLGFTHEPRLYPTHIWTNVSLPVFITAASSGQDGLLAGFIKSHQHHFPDHLLIVYDLGLDPIELSTVNKFCNTSNCLLRKFNFELYPSHVSNLKFFAHRPIIIQEVLNQAGAVFWIDVHHQFISGQIMNVLKQAQKEGLASWGIDHPTSRLTHPRMFEYFHTQQESYFFHRMVQPSHIALYNTDTIHQQIMLPWVQCALVSDCIAPIGAQGTGCRFDKKPMYRYSGCHRYDMSALNVVLGIKFDFTATPYMANDTDKFFQLVEVEESKTIDSYSKENSTNPSPEETRQLPE